MSDPKCESCGLKMSGDVCLRCHARGLARDYGWSCPTCGESDVLQVDWRDRPGLAVMAERLRERLASRDPAEKKPLPMFNVPECDACSIPF